MPIGSGPVAGVPIGDVALTLWLSTDGASRGTGTAGLAVVFPSTAAGASHSDDAKGAVSATTPAGGAVTGAFVVVTFSTAYQTAPVGVNLTPQGTTDFRVSASSITTAGFTVYVTNVGSMAAATAYTVAYNVIASPT